MITHYVVYIQQYNVKNFLCFWVYDEKVALLEMKIFVSLWALQLKIILR